MKMIIHLLSYFVNALDMKAHFRKISANHPSRFNIPKLSVCLLRKPRNSPGTLTAKSTQGEIQLTLISNLRI